MPGYILALDQGTTSSRSILFDKKGAIVQIAQKEFTQIFPQPGWVEHDAEEIWATQRGTIAEVIALANITEKQIVAIGITNQRETTVVWEKATGKPICNAIVWQDRRTAPFCDQLKQQGYAPAIQKKTGLVLDAYFSATKLAWILNNVSGAKEKAEAGQLAFGTIDSWLVWKLTNGKIHITDVTNASRTMLYNIHTLQWDTELLELFSIPYSILPEVKPNSMVYGYFDGIPIAGMAGDQQAALFGQMCIDPGMVKNTYGTGCFMLMNTGANAITSKNNLLTTIAWQLDGKTAYALEGSVFIGGAIVQWLRDGLKIIQSSKEVERLAATVQDSDGVYVVPAFAGLGAPYWNSYARGSIFGLTRGATNGHIARAALDSIAYQTYEVVKAMEADSGISISELRVDGGATTNNVLMQFQSDLLSCNVLRPVITETTALGAAFLAGLSVGFWSEIKELKEQWMAEMIFNPNMEDNQRDQLIIGWQRAVKATISWAENK